MGPGCSALYRVVTEDYANPALLQYKWVPLLQGTDSGPRAHLGGGTNLQVGPLLRFGSA